jgi:hypothetical protein
MPQLRRPRSLSSGNLSQQNNTLEFLVQLPADRTPTLIFREGELSECLLDHFREVALPLFLILDEVEHPHNEGTCPLAGKPSHEGKIVATEQLNNKSVIQIMSLGFSFSSLPSHYCLYLLINSLIDPKLTLHTDECFLMPLSHSYPSSNTNNKKL